VRIFPNGRSMDFAIWRACERVGIRPPGIKDSWDQNQLMQKAQIIAYNQLREYGEDKKEQEYYKFMSGKPI
jgi:hypothetical protein